MAAQLVVAVVAVLIIALVVYLRRDRAKNKNAKTRDVVQIMRNSLQDLSNTLVDGVDSSENSSVTEMCKMYASSLVELRDALGAATDVETRNASAARVYEVLSESDSKFEKFADALDLSSRGDAAEKIDGLRVAIRQLGEVV